MTNFLDRNRWNRCVDGLRANPGVDFYHLEATFGLCQHRTFFAAGQQLHALLATDINDGQRISGVDQVRIFDLGIFEPDFRPVPRVTQKDRGDVPQGIAFLYNVGLR